MSTGSRQHPPLEPRLEEIGKKIVHAAFVIHKHFGPGVYENIYEVCFCRELEKAGLEFKRQCSVPIHYDGIEFDEGYKLDVIVEKSVICELKAVVEMHPVFDAQILSYMKLSEVRLGYLINFHVPLIKDGIKRFIL